MSAHSIISERNSPILNQASNVVCFQIHVVFIIAESAYITLRYGQHCDGFQGYESTT